MCGCFLEKLRIVPREKEDKTDHMEMFRQILSAEIVQPYMMRQIGLTWYREMEDIFENVPVGTRILVRRDRVWSIRQNQFLIHDYMTTREEHPMLLGRPWSHQDVAYVENEESPYPHDVDAFHTRDEIMENHRNNHSIESVSVTDEMDVSSDVPPVRPLTSRILFSFSPSPSS